MTAWRSRQNTRKTPMHIASLPFPRSFYLARFAHLSHDTRLAWQAALPFVRAVEAPSARAALALVPIKVPIV